MIQNIKFVIAKFFQQGFIGAKGIRLIHGLPHNAGLVELMRGDAERMQRADGNA